MGKLNFKISARFMKRSGRAGRLTKFLWASLVLNAMFAVSALYSASELPDKDTTTTTVMRTTTVDLAGKPLP